MKISFPKKLTVLALLLLGLNGSFAQTPSPKLQAEAEREARLAWWSEAKFGMFIHWGVYSLAGGDWKGTTDNAEWLQRTGKIPIAEYTEFAKGFNPLKFDAETWVKTAKDAGMKYIVITAKHHDGFAMFDSPSDPYNVVKGTAFGRDPIKDLAAACQKEGLHFCVYYSLGRDWHDPDVPTGSGKSAGYRSNLIDFPDESAKDFSKYFERKVKPQMKELLTQYGPIGIMWFDTPEKITKAESVELLSLIHSIQPDCIEDDRIGNGQGDYQTPEQQIPNAVWTRPWETCMTISPHWGYNKHDTDLKPADVLLKDLIDVVSKGGNFLLNVGPTGDGIIPSPNVDRLTQIGSWLRLNGEAIYGAGPTPFGAELGAASETEKDKSGKPVFVPELKWRATTKPGHIYLMVFEWPSNGTFSVPAVSQKLIGASLLADPSVKLVLNQDSTGVTISGLPAHPPDAVATVISLDYPVAPLTVAR